MNSHALPGIVPEKLEIDMEGDVLPAELAASHATKYCDNIHPVSHIVRSKLLVLLWPLVISVYEVSRLLDIADVRLLTSSRTI